MTARALRCLLLLLSLVVAHDALAQAASYRLDSVISPGPSSFLRGVVEIAARIDNPGAQTLAGEVVVVGSDFDRAAVTSRAPFSVAAGSNALVRLPVVGKQQLRAEIRVAGQVVQSSQLNPVFEQAVRVFDANDPSRLRAALDGMSVNISGGPAGRGPTGGIARLRFLVPVLDSTSGDVVLPTRGASWQGVHLVVLPASRLEALTHEEAESLALFVMAGGTLALHAGKPEDLRGERLRALAGGTPRETPAGYELLRDVPPPSGPRGSDVNPLEERPSRREDLALVGYEGGNMRSSSFGASAAYGLGEVVLLGFDPRNPEVLRTPWFRTRLVELARRAYERMGIAAVRLGEVKGAAFSRGMGGGPMSDQVRQLLDPNATARWGIGLAALLVCLYAVLAGPVMFTRAKNKQRPLAALLALPLLSISTFLLIVFVGYVAKGTGQISRRLTLVEAGGGMEAAVSRRYRAFFSQNAQEISVGASTRTGMLSLEMDEGLSFGLLLDGDGLRVADFEGSPGQTVVVREDSIHALGGGVALIPDKSGDGLTIVNRSGHDLRGLVVKPPHGPIRYLKSLSDGERITYAEIESSGSPALWERHPVAPLGDSPPIYEFYSLSDMLTRNDNHEAAAAWLAVASTVPDDLAWFPAGVPVVLAEMLPRGSPGKDSGVPIEQDTTLLRVVGFGGAP